MAYADVYNVMEMTKELVSGLILAVKGHSRDRVPHTQGGETYNLQGQLERTMAMSRIDFNARRSY
jgi:lysyl-tRNA synthetase class II